MRKQDTAWFVALGAALVSGFALLRRRVGASVLFAVGAVGAGIASRRWSRDAKAPFPYSLRWILRELLARAEACGFRFVQRHGSTFAYVAQFEAA